MKVVVLAGGSGTRLWPFSRKSYPKQFHQFGDQKSLLQKTLERFVGKYPLEDILIVTNQDYFHLVKAQAKKIAPELEKQIVVEPESRNTAPAIAFALAHLQNSMAISGEECFLVCSSDHAIAPDADFLAVLDAAEKIGSGGKNVIFGIRPQKPETGYGYIRLGKKLADQGYEVQQFVEKPDYPTAQKYVAAGDYFWNSGIFLFQVENFVNELTLHCPVIAEKLSGGLKALTEGFGDLPEISIDYALMEKSQNSIVMPLDLTWSDVGSWDSVYEIMDKDSQQNVKVGNVVEIDTKGCLIMGGKRLISTIGLEDIVIIETEDALFVGKRGESQRVKALVEELKKRNSKEPLEHLTMHRPWGKYTILEEGDRYKIKRICVEPGQRLSLQLHYHRSEHWVVIKGTAKVTVDDTESLIHENESIYVPKGSVHRMENPGKVMLELIEVQVGEYVGEDDIVRLQDDYLRTCTFQ